MGRRKRDLHDDLSDSSNGEEDDDGSHAGFEDADVREERQLHEDPYHRKKRQRNGKNSTIYGNLMEGDDDDLGSRSRGLGGGIGSSSSKRTPSFVNGKTTILGDDEAIESEEAQSPEDEEENDDDESSASSEEGAAMRDNNSETSSVMNLDGAEDEPENDNQERENPSAFSAFTTTARAFSNRVDQETTSNIGIGSGRGIGSSRGGIGSTVLPSAFGSESKRPQRSFVRQESNLKKPLVPLAADEAVHFNKIQNTFGAKMLAKMGWELGSGLGATGEGIITPIETKLRKAKAGIAHGGFKERTKQSIREAKRRGEVVSEDDENLTPAQRKAKAKTSKVKETREQWKKPSKKKKAVIQHRTYEEIMEETGADTGIGVIIDATGATPREVTSLSEISASPWGATNDPVRLPELRHNMKLIVEQAKNELDGLAKEAKAIQVRQKWVNDEDHKLRKQISEEADLIQKMQQMHILIDEINEKTKEMADQVEPSLSTLSKPVMGLVQQYPKEYTSYKVDDVVVAAIAPVLRRLLSSWDPLQEPTFVADELTRWKKALRMSAVPSTEIVGHNIAFKTPLPTKNDEHIMTPYEALLWNVWMPKMRSCINNDWNPESPQPLIKVIEAWTGVLPQFIKDNVFDQLIIPKLHKTISEWSPKRSERSLQALVFPWLPHVGPRLDMVLEDAKRKVKSLFRSWTVDQGIPEDLMIWENVFDSADWENVLLKYAVPKLGASLRDDFKINPKQQDMKPLSRVLDWSKRLRPSIIAQLLEAEFFPKWLNVLHIWLTHPSANFEEVLQWYTFWKTSFPEDVYIMPRVAHGFAAGLQLMNNAVDLGPEAPLRLKKIDFRPLGLSASIDKNETKKVRGVDQTADVTFRSIVEDYAAQHNLLFVPSEKVHEKSRMSLYKVSPSLGKGGILVYILDDAVWTSVDDGSDYRAISLEDMVLRATRAKK